jgi:hypothetical protein
VNLPEVLQPFRSNLFGQHIIEHLPRVMPITAAGDLAPGLPDIGRSFGKSLRQAAKDLSATMDHDIAYNHPELLPWDVRPHNVALTREGRGIIHDAGAIMSGDRNHPIPFPAAHDFSNVDLDAVLRAGGPSAIRDAMSQALELGTKHQGVPLPTGMNADHIRHWRHEADWWQQAAGYDPLSEAISASTRTGLGVAHEDPNALMNALQSTGGRPPGTAIVRRLPAVLGLLAPYELARAAAALEKQPWHPSLETFGPAPMAA